MTKLDDAKAIIKAAKDERKAEIVAKIDEVIALIQSPETSALYDDGLPPTLINLRDAISYHRQQIAPVVIEIVEHFAPVV